MATFILLSDEKYKKRNNRHFYRKSRNNLRAQKMLWVSESQRKTLSNSAKSCTEILRFPFFPASEFFFL